MEMKGITEHSILWEAAEISSRVKLEIYEDKNTFG